MGLSDLIKWDKIELQYNKISEKVLEQTECFML